MHDLRSEARDLLRRPCCILKDEGRPSCAELIQRYSEGELLADLESRNHLLRCLRYAQAIGNGPASEEYPERDAQYFYQRAAALLQKIEAEVSTDGG